MRKRTFTVLGKEYPIETLRYVFMYVEQDYKLDKFGRIHCTDCGAIMMKIWNDELLFWEWHCMKCSRASMTSMVTEPAIQDAINEWRRLGRKI